MLLKHTSTGNLVALLLSRYWNLEPRWIEAFKNESKKHGLEHYAQDTLNQLWKMSKGWAPMMECRYKKGFIDEWEKGENPQPTEQEFENINDWLKFLNTPIDTNKGKVAKATKKRVNKS